MNGQGFRLLVSALWIVLCAGTAVLAQPAPQLPGVPAPNAPAPGAQVPGAQVPGVPVPGGPAAAAVAPETPRTLSADTRAARARLEGYKTILTEIELGLESRTHSDADLQALRQQIDPIEDGIRALIVEQAPRLEASRARLSQLGPKPKDGQPAESTDAADDRAEREAAVAEFDETQRLARAVLLQAEQLGTQVGDLRRSNFARALFEKSDTLLSFDLWKDVIRAVPRELRAQRTILSDVVDQTRRNATLPALLLLGLAIGGAVALYQGRRKLAHRFLRHESDDGVPSRRASLLAALTSLFLGAAPAILGCWLVWLAFESAEIFPDRLEDVMASLLGGIAFVAFVRALIDAIFAPSYPYWRLVAVSDASAHRIMRFGVTLATVAMTGKVLESFNHAIGAALPITVLSRALFSLALALILAEMLRRFSTRANQDESCLGPYVASEFSLGGPLRLLGWILVTIIVASVLGGFVAMASFAADQAMWIAILLGLLSLAWKATDEFIGDTFRTQSRLVTALQANTGLRRRSVEQIGLLLNGVMRLCLVVIVVMLVLAQWGVGSLDMVGSIRSVRSIFFGFAVGDVTISMSSILIAALLFAGIVIVTRIVQRWLDQTFLPATDLDAGLRNSIRTAVGYVGIITAGMIAFSYMGLSLERLTIVAGALSVGIGFGLQSIVNNFISGLILLWERPIRVGDLVVVGDGEGYVRRINVRSTEIQTADRSTLIVPNSNLISGIVRNRVRNDRIGRVLVSVPVPRASDPDHVADILRRSALAHREIMSEPSPRVVFKKVTENTLDFDLICFVDDIDSAGRVASDLYFDIFRTLRREGMGVPGAPPRIAEPQEAEAPSKAPDEDESLTLLKDKPAP